jgi:hypothetical protein
MRLQVGAHLILLSLAVLFPHALAAQGVPIYSNDFNQVPNRVYPEWSSSVIAYTNTITPPGSGTLPAQLVTSTNSPNNTQRFLGLFGGPPIGAPADPGWNRTRVDQTITLSLTNLPPHEALHLAFDLYIIRSWDGDSPTYGPDRFTVSVAYGPTLLDATFSNNSKTNSDKSYQSYPVPHSAPWTGALSTGTLGYDRFFRDATYRLEYSFPHASSTVRINFSSSLFEGKGTGDEAWGLDNAVVSTTTQPKGDGDFLFTSFRGNGEDGLHLALSDDGYHWQALKNDSSFLKPLVGAKLMRDPCLALGPDGDFHLVWTTSWTAEKGKVIGYAHSTDLVHWSEQRAIPVMENEPATRNIWAPEIFYESTQQRWLIFWSTTIPGRFPESDTSGDDGYNHRVYCATTRNFQEVGPSRLLFDPGFNVIDATIFQDADKYYLFFKDERKQPLKKNLRYSVAVQSEGPYGPPGEPFTGDWVEGPSAIKIKGEYIVYFDHYAAPHYYGAVRSKDLKTWEDCSKEMSFPKGHRHGTVLRIPRRMAEQLEAPE